MTRCLAMALAGLLIAGCTRLGFAPLAASDQIDASFDAGNVGFDGRPLTDSLVADSDQGGAASDARRTDGLAADTLAADGSTVVTVTVGPLYPTAGARWNDYVTNDGPSQWTASDSPCAPSVATHRLDCLHAGELRAVALPPAVASCVGVSAEDALGLLRWRCSESPGRVLIHSVALAPGRGLRDAVTAQGWTDNSLRVHIDGVLRFESAPAKWWSNPVVAVTDPAGGPLILSAASTIYLAGQDALNTSGVALTADGVAFVAHRGARVALVPGAANCATTKRCAVRTVNRSRTWIEATIDAATAHYGVLESGSFNVVNGTSITAGSVGLSLAGAYGRARDLAVQRASVNGIVTSGRGTMLLRARVAMGTSTCCAAGLVWRGQDIVGSDIVLSSAFRGGDIGSNNSTLTRLLSVNNRWGFERTDRNKRMTFSHLTMSNELHAVAGFTYYPALNSTWVQVVSYGHRHQGLSFYGSNHTVAHFASANNGAAGVYVWDASDNNHFAGLLMVGNNSPACSVSALPAAPGLIDTSCTQDGSDGSSDYPGQTSTAVLRTGVDLSSSFVGAISEDDPANLSDTAGRAPFTDIVDWSGFSHPWRVWGRGRNACAASTCGIIDWRLRGDDDQIRERSENGRIANAPFVLGASCPPALHGDRVITDRQRFSYHKHRRGVEVSGNANGVCEPSEQCANAFLINAVEIMEDAIGDDDGLCESDEACIYSPNIGAYQGEGALSGPCAFQDGIVTGVRVLAYVANGA